ncbi:unnamed protein product [Phaeothamnion confervicola]
MADKENGLSQSLDERETELYDRQIRLWGVEAQQRMGSSKVLFAGVHAVSMEVAKNLVLAGISATLQDDELMTAADIGANCLARLEDVGKNRAEACRPRVQELNLLAAVDSVTKPLAALDDVFLRCYNVVCLCGAPLAQQRRVDAACRRLGLFFYAVETFGYDGYVFCDLFRHAHRVEAGQKLSDPVLRNYASLDDAISAPWATLKDRWGPVPRVFVWAQLLLAFEARHGHRPRCGDTADVTAMEELCAARLEAEGLPLELVTRADLGRLCAAARAEVAPVCAVLGGIVGQEVLKTISQKGTPTDNVFVFDGLSGEGKTFRAPKR